jgi:hypothetical protein
MSSTVELAGAIGLLAAWLAAAGFAADMAGATTLNARCCATPHSALSWQWARFAFRAQIKPVRRIDRRPRRSADSLDGAR